MALVADERDTRFPRDGFDEGGLSGRQDQVDRDLLAIAGQIRDALIIVDNRGEIEFFNSRAEKIFGIRQWEAVGRRIEWLVSVAEDQPDALSGQDSGDDDAPPFREGVVIGRAHNGKPIRLAARRGQLVSEHSGARYFLLLRPLRGTNPQSGETSIPIQTVLKASAIRSRFLSAMGHELRTRLNAILGFSQLLGDVRFGRLSEKQDSYVEIIQSNSKELQKLVNQHLDLARIESGQMKLDAIPLDPSDAITAALEVVAGLAKQRRVMLIDQRSRLDRRIIGDDKRIQQILISFLCSVIQDCSKKAFLTLRTEIIENRQLRIILDVADSSTGLPNMREMFDSHSNNEPRHEGAGHGMVELFLLRTLVEAMGGLVGIDTVDDSRQRVWIEFSLV